MTNPSSETVTEVLAAAREGSPQAAAKLLPLVYTELRRQAEIQLARVPPGQTLQPTALVHEAYLRLVGDADPGWENRRHFFAAAANAMRNILVEQARRKAAIKRGGGRQRVELDDATMAIEPPTENILAINEALKKLERRDPRAGQVVTLRFFVGLTEEETAKVLDISPRTVRREWAYARAYLHRELTGDISQPDDGTSNG